MPSLGMQRPYKLDNKTIDSEVSLTSAGNYALCEKDSDGKFLVDYVGRSDNDVNARLKAWVEKIGRAHV